MNKAMILIGAIPLLLAACGGAAPATTSTPTGTSTAITLRFRANGTPDLSGLTFPIGNAAGSAHTGDTNVYDLVQFLTKWGASATQTNASQNATELAVASGTLISTSGPLPTEVDAGLTVFGPNQARVDYVLLAKKSIRSLADLRGQTVAICCTAAPDAVLLSAALKKAHLSQSDLTVLHTGASSASLDALIAGKVSAAFVHSNGVPQAGSGYHVIAVGATLLPQYADSFMAARPNWLKSHPAMAEAIDLAWLASAKLFNTDEKAWVANAAAYTDHADTTAQYQATWQELRGIQGWPTAASIFSTSVAAFNLKVAREQGAITGAGDRPLSQLVDVGPWEQAWKVFSQHESAY
jgi:ABC-type nitrate/sulfonate/bicarbonate transport system substrate-binding protein